MSSIPPDEGAASLINDTLSDLSQVAALPTGQPRDLNLDQVLVVGQVRAQLAIASALLAVADAIRLVRQEPTP